MKKFSIFFITVCFSVMITMTAFAGQWQQNTTGWWYQNDDGNYFASQWAVIDGKQYYFNADGYMVTGWMQSLQGDWYYLNPTGELRYDELTENGRVYYFDSNGKCTNPEGNEINFESDYQSILDREKIEAQKRLMDQKPEGKVYEENIVYYHDVSEEETENRFGLADMQF
ncbi:MAG: hypothetical protein KH366_10495 [Clostridiaceae bacterium]|nr:hypothetical protein [Clostridiaceae bacterium]